VRLVGDVEQRDRYGRLLAYVYREPDGAFVNARLVRDGYARTLTIAPNVAHAHELADLARAARRAHRGLWSAC
jgi:micrococcal nuclease